MARHILLVFLVFLGAPTMAQVVSRCDGSSTIQSIGETKSYANGAITMTVMNLGEPAEGENNLFILHPVPEEGTVCSVLRFDETRGFASLAMTETPASYDPARGLTAQFAGIFVIPEGAFQNSIVMDITVNQATGGISVQSQLGRE